MTRTQINVALAALLTTLAETGSAPSGVLFAALQAHDAELYTLGRYERLVELMLSGELVTQTNYQLELTTKGREMARMIEEHARSLRVRGGL